MLLNLEHIDTDSGFKNSTYNHNLYRSGYRYKGFPIGANIDADSHSSIISLTKYTNNKYFKFKYRKFNINQNNNQTTIWGDPNIIGQEFIFTYNVHHKNNLNIEVIALARDFKNFNYDDSSIFLKIEKRI